MKLAPSTKNAPYNKSLQLTNNTPLRSVWCQLSSNVRVQNMDITKNMKWILISVLLFALGHYTIRTAANNLSLANPSFTEYMSWLNALALFLYFICGAVSSYISKKQPVITGTVTGLLSAITAIIVFNVAATDASGKAITLVTGIVLGALGGFVVKKLSKGGAHAL